VLPEAERLEQRLRAFRRAARLDAPKPCDEFEIFERVELVIELRLVRQPGDDPLGRNRLAARVDPKMWISPLSAGKRPATMRKVVDLPAPLGPSRA